MHICETIDGLVGAWTFKETNLAIRSVVGAEFQSQSIILHIVIILRQGVEVGIIGHVMEQSSFAIERVWAQSSSSQAT